MRKLWIMGMLAVVIVGLLTTTAAVAGWFWGDPAWQIGDTEVHLQWAVDDPNGTGDYRAEVGLVHPKGVEVKLITPSTKQERAYSVASPKLKVTSEGVEIQGVFRVNARHGADGENVLVSIVANGQELASVTGAMNKRIVLSAVVPQDE